MNSFMRIGGAALLLIFLVSTIVIAAPADDDKPRIFINTASDIGELLGDNALLAPLKQIVQKQGFEFEHGLHSNLTTGSPLEGIDVYVLFNPNFPVTDADKIALRKWVRAGGILLMGDAFTPVVMDAFSREFGVAHGVRHEEIRGYQLELTPNSLLSGPVQVGNPTSSFFRTLEIIDDTRAEALLKDDNGNTLMTRSISFTGKGEIFTFGCPLILLDKFKSEQGLDDPENIKLVQNLFTYIYNKLNGNLYDLNLLKVKSKGGNSFLPGDKIKFVAKIRNIGAIESEATSVAFYLEKVGPAPSARIEIATANVPVRKAKKKVKIAKNATLPNDLAPGTYEVIAVVDPDGDTDDVNAGNNTTTAKKKIVIQ